MHIYIYHDICIYIYIMIYIYNVKLPIYIYMLTLSDACLHCIDYVCIGLHVCLHECVTLKLTLGSGSLAYQLDCLSLALTISSGNLPKKLVIFKSKY